jgi:hypothetical protein
MLKELLESCGSDTTAAKVFFDAEVVVGRVLFTT